jgi:hypothetical protein
VALGLDFGAFGFGFVTIGAEGRGRERAWDMKDGVGFGRAGVGFAGLEDLLSALSFFWMRVSIRGGAPMHALACVLISK